MAPLLPFFFFFTVCRPLKVKISARLLLRAGRQEGRSERVRFVPVKEDDLLLSLSLFRIKKRTEFVLCFHQRRKDFFPFRSRPFFPPLSWFRRIREIFSSSVFFFLQETSFC